MTTAELGFNKSAEGESTARLHILNALLFAGLWGMTFFLYYRLPEMIPGHVGPGGAIRWEPRTSGTWFIAPILGTGSVLLMYALAGLGAGSPEAVNIPQKKRLLALPREGQRYAMRPLRVFMFGMATWLLVLMLYIQYSMYRIAMQAQAGAPDTGHLLPGILLMTAVPLLMAVRLSRVVGRRIDEWERENG